MMATTSATLWPGMMCGSTARFEYDAPRHFIRFSFCKKDETLDSAIARLEAYLKP